MAAMIPKRVDLPRRFRIRVLQLPLGELQRILEEKVTCPDCGREIRNKEAGLVEGFWWSYNRTIYLNEALGGVRKREVFRHELLHACHDWTWERY